MGQFLSCFFFLIDENIYSPDNVVKTKLDPKTGNPTEIIEENIYDSRDRIGMFSKQRK